MKVSIVVALGPNLEMGFENKLLWHIKEDLINFKKITMGKAVVMGRKTFDSIGKPLPHRLNIVISRDINLKISGVEVIDDPLLAFELALNYDESEESELMVIGGAEIYRYFLPFTQKIYLSKMEYDGKCDTFFPAIDFSTWNEIEKIKFDQFEFLVLEKK